MGCQRGFDSRKWEAFHKQKNIGSKFDKAVTLVIGNHIFPLIIVFSPLGLILFLLISPFSRSQEVESFFPFFSFSFSFSSSTRFGRRASD